MISIRAEGKADFAAEFAFSFVALATVAATLSICAPIQLSIATVFLFAGPHNWLEARYFLSRLPARFGKFKRFFAWSFGGIAILMASYIALMCWLKGFASVGIIQNSIYPAAFLAAWNAAFILWTVRLVQLSGKWKQNCDTGLALPFGFLTLAFACAFPSWFSLALIYLHPFIGCWILDRELQRSRPGWRSTYHRCLMTIPIFLAAIFYCLCSTNNVSTSDILSAQIQTYAGAAILPNVPPRMLVALHTFLEILHYSVWLIAIPLVSAGWRRWRPVAIPMVQRSEFCKRNVSLFLAASTFAVVILWFCFGFNYPLTRDVYFTLAMAHVLAEIPFLLKTLS